MATSNQYVNPKDIPSKIRNIATPPRRMKYEVEEKMPRNYRNVSCDGLLADEKKQQELTAKMKRKVRNQKYYEKHRAKVLSKNKEYNKIHNEKYKEYQKNYYKNNDDELKEYAQSRRDIEKHHIEIGAIEKPKPKIVKCECGWEGRQSSLTQHKRIAKRHQNYLLEQSLKKKEEIKKVKKPKKEEIKKVEEKPKITKIKLSKKAKENKKRIRKEKEDKKPKEKKIVVDDYLNEYGNNNEELYMDY